MKRPILVKFGLSFLPTLQYSSTPKQVVTCTENPANGGIALISRTRFSMLNKLVNDSFE
jgi:hypothetical protein